MDGEMVTVACKLPCGLHLDLPGHERVTLKGFAFQLGVPEAMPTHAITGGFALTPNVPKDFFDEWLKRNADLDLVRKGLIFSSSRPDRVRGEAKEKEELRSGLEPLDPSKPGDRLESFKTGVTRF